jgi:hypothetical protein
MFLSHYLQVFVLLKRKYFCRFLLEEMVRKSHAFYGTWMLITMFKSPFMNPVLSHIFIPCILKIHFNIILHLHPSLQVISSLTVFCLKYCIPVFPIYAYAFLLNVVVLVFGLNLNLVKAFFLLIFCFWFSPF